MVVQGVPLGPEGLGLLHFYDLCEHLTGEKVLYENQDINYYDIVTEDALSRELPGSIRYDAILVDEGQYIQQHRLPLLPSRPGTVLGTGVATG